MEATFLRALQAAILASDECAPFVTANVPKWLTPPSEESVLGEDGKSVLRQVPGVPNPDCLPASEVYERDLAIARLINTAGFGAKSRAVPCHQAKKLLIKRGKWRRIALAAENPDHQAVETAFAAVALAEDARMEADFLDPEATPMLNGLVSAGLISAEDKLALESMCRVQSTVTPEQVSRALRGPWGDEQTKE